MILNIVFLVLGILILFFFAGLAFRRNARLAMTNLGFLGVPYVAALNSSLFYFTVREPTDFSAQLLRKVVDIGLTVGTVTLFIFIMLRILARLAAPRTLDAPLDFFDQINVYLDIIAEIIWFVVPTLTPIVFGTTIPGAISFMEQSTVALIAGLTSIAGTLILSIVGNLLTDKVRELWNSRSPIDNAKVQPRNRT